MRPARRPGGGCGVPQPAMDLNNSSREGPMLWTIAVVLMVLWALGLVSSYTMGGFIHILLVVAVITVLVSIIQGRRVV
ncbi:MAG: lmo0937 family membrane protein [Candidatus Manganitrophaceae bacterium]